MFVNIKLKYLLLCALLCVGCVLTVCVSVGVAETQTSSLLNYTIVLDAGHGGVDGGSVGVETGVAESEIVLSVTKKLQSLLCAFGFNVVLTRNDENGLYDENAESKKISDMEARSNIIQNADADMVVSIHANSWPDESQIGAQTFYQSNSEQSKLLADAVQTQLYKNVDFAREHSNHADLFILQCTLSPSIVVECGFLSNPLEEELLVTDGHQQTIAYSIFAGIIKFFNYK